MTAADLGSLARPARHADDLHPPTAAMTATTTPPSPLDASDRRREAERLLAELAELAASTQQETRAFLLHEAATLLERAGDDAAAVRDYLSAYNEDPENREPLESLVALLVRRRSVKNLGKLLDALVRAAGTPEEAGRALVEKAAFALERVMDAGAAKDALREAVTEAPGELSAWLELELLAAKEQDAGARLEALEERAAQAEPPAWRALLLLDVGALHSATDDVEKAVAATQAAARLESPTRFRALSRLVDLARKSGADGLAAETLESLAELVTDALSSPDRRDASGIPRDSATPTQAALRWVWAALARRRLGETGRATELLARAAALLPDEPLLPGLALDLAEARGDGEAAADLAHKLLASGATGQEAAALWMRVEEHAAGQGDREAALAALGHALTADPGNIPAAGLKLDFLCTDPSAEAAAESASSLEALADHLPHPEAKARTFVRAAWEWAVFAKNVPAAKAALSQAGALGANATTTSRIARTLADLQDDPTWYEDATRRLIASTPGSDENAALWLEIVRSRLLRRDREGVDKALTELGEFPDSRWLARALSAYAVPLAGSVGGPAAIDALAEVEPDDAQRRALLVVAAARALATGDSPGTRERLEKLHAESADDLAVAGMLAEVHRRAGAPREAARVLLAAADATDEPADRAALAMEAGLLAFEAGDKPAGLDALRKALAWHDSAAPLLTWALRSADPDTLSAREEALDAAADGEPPQIAALERLGLEVCRPDGDVLAAVEKLEALATGPLRLSAALARLVLGDPTDRAARDAALELIEGASQGGAKLAHAERMRLARDVDQDRVGFARHAAAWAAAEPGPSAALEWLGASVALEDHDGEAAALLLLAEQVQGAPREALVAESRLVSYATQQRGLPPVSGTTTAVKLLGLELAPPGSDPRRRLAALAQLDATTVGADVALDALALAGWNQLAQGAAMAAFEAFRAVTDARPDDLAAWEGVRTAARDLDDAQSLAVASARLGELCKNDRRAAGYWEEAGLILLDVLREPELGEDALAAAFQRDPSRLAAFDKLFRRLRDRGADDRLFELATRRLEVTDDEREIAKLYWEQARVLRKKGDLDGALEALTNVTMLEPDHVGAIALTGEIFIKKGALDDAAAALEKLVTHPGAPAEQRLVSGVAAVDLYEKRLQAPDKALRVLLALHAAGLSTMPVRERIASVATRVGDFKEATAILEQLMTERDTAEGRIAAARLAMAIWRDKLHEPRGARASVERLLSEAPGDGEAVDLLLTQLSGEPWATQAIAASRQAIVAALGRGRLDADAVARLASIGRLGGDGALLQATLGVLVALGRDEPGIAEELLELEARVARTPQIQVDDQVLARISDPEDAGPLVPLFQLLGETIGEALGPSREGLGVSKRERIDPRAGLPLRNEIASWVGALGLGEFELYMGGRDPHGVQGVASEIPALVVGQAVTSPLSPAARQAIAREVFALRRGITVVRTRDEATVASIVVSACQLADLRLDAPPFAIFGDVHRQMSKAISRKVKKALPEVCRAVVERRSDATAWARAAQRSLDRMSAIAAGDVALVLSDILGIARAELRRGAPNDPRAEALLRFVLSPTYLELRQKLGMGVR